jgi:hypothetical protein
MFSSLGSEREALAGSSITRQPAANPVEEGGAVKGVVESPVTGFVLTMVAKQFTQPIAEDIVNRFTAAATNSMLKEVGGQPVTPDEMGRDKSGQRSGITALLTVAPPGIDIGISTLAGAITYTFSEAMWKPVMVEYVRQYPTTFDFVTKVYGQ